MQTGDMTSRITEPAGDFRKRFASEIYRMKDVALDRQETIEGCVDRHAAKDDVDLFFRIARTLTMQLLHRNQHSRSPDIRGLRDVLRDSR